MLLIGGGDEVVNETGLRVVGGYVEIGVVEEAW